MVDEVTAGFRYLRLALAVLFLPSAVFAHQLDEYLQATLVTVEPGGIRLQINLTPGVAVAEKVLTLIDRDNDGLISTNEAATYAELLRGDLVARVDQRNVELKLRALDFPAPAELRTGWGIIQMEFAVTPGPLAAGAHVFTLENGHLNGISVYLFNAAQPSSGLIKISRQNRNETQSLGEIEFTYAPPLDPLAWPKHFVWAAGALLAAIAAAWLAVKTSRCSA